MTVDTSDNMFLGIFLGLVSSAVAGGLTWRFLSPTSRFYLLDHPNERSLHTRPTPRMGGIAVLAAIFVSGLFATLVFGGYPVEWLWFGGVGSILAAVSLADDRVGLPVSVRLATHVLVAVVMVAVGFGLRVLEPSGESVPLLDFVFAAMALFFIVWMINLYNFMDGMDGFAGGMTVVGFGTFALLGWLGESNWFAVSSLIVAGAAGGFLVFNFPPARIFMGDAGSTTIGFLAASFTLWADQQDLFPVGVGILVFSPFIVDATVTLLRRLVRGEKVWRAHKTHFYQRLVQLGWGHRKTVLWEYSLMLACAATAVWGARQGEITQWMVLSVWTLIYLVLAFTVRKLEADKAPPDKAE